MKEFSYCPELFYKEWLVTNGLGGYACGSIGGVLLRKYHGFLISALKAPLGRSVMLNFVADSIIFDNQEFHLNGNENKPSSYLIEFRQENLMPIWRYQIGEIQIEKKVWMAHGQNTVYIRYQLFGGNQPIQIKWRPYLNFRSCEEPINANNAAEYEVHGRLGGYEITRDKFPGLKLLNRRHPSFMIDFHCIEEVLYQMKILKLQIEI